MIIADIAGKEKRKVETIDVFGDYLQTHLRDETVIVKLVRRMAELLKMIDPKTYRSYITMKKGRRYYAPNWRRYSTE